MNYPETYTVSGGTASPDRLYIPDLNIFKRLDQGTAFGFDPKDGKLLSMKSICHYRLAEIHGYGNFEDIPPTGRFWYGKNLVFLAWWEEPTEAHLHKVIQKHDLYDKVIYQLMPGATKYDRYDGSIPKVEIDQARVDLLRQQHLDALAKKKLRKDSVGKFGSAAIAAKTNKAGYATPAQFNAQWYGESVAKFLHLFETRGLTFPMDDPKMGTRFRGMEGYGVWMLPSGNIIPVPDNHAVTAKEYFPEAHDLDEARVLAWREGWLLVRALKHNYSTPRLTYAGYSPSDKQVRRLTKWGELHGYEVEQDTSLRPR